MEKRELVNGDIVQLSPEYGRGFGGHFLFVTHPKSFGCQGYILGEVEGAVTYKGKAYLRPTWDKMEYVGRAVWIEKDSEIPDA